MKNYLRFCLFLLISLGLTFSHAQTCDSLVPSFVVDLSLKADSLWSSPDTSRNGYCCSASGIDKCIEFEVTTHSSAVGVIVNMSGTLPSGDLYVRADCGPEILLADTVFLSSNGPHNITFCRPGNNYNIYSIQSVVVTTTIAEKSKIHPHITLSPNPSTGIIKVNSQLAAELKFKIIDLSGKVHIQAGLESSGTIDISQLSKGVYFIELINSRNAFIEQRKIIKY